MSIIRNILGLALGLALAGTAAAGRDPLLGLDPRALSAPGFEASFGGTTYERWLWYGEASGGSAQGSQPRRFADYRSQKAVDLDLLLRWQASPAAGLELLLPWRSVEYSPYSNGSAFSANDPLVVRGDGAGDVALRGRLSLARAGGVKRSAEAGLFASVAAPTGIGPYQAGHPLAATGSGGWAAQGGLLAAEHTGSLRLWQQVSGSWHLGYEGSLAASLSLTTQAAYPEGNAFLRPGAGLECSGGALGLLSGSNEAQWWAGCGVRLAFTRELEAGGQAVAGTNTKTLELVPQLCAEFPPAFTLLLGVRYPLILVHQAGSAAWEPLFRADLGF